MLILCNKPMKVLLQFTDSIGAGSPRFALSDYIDLPGVYPAGRLDRESEGLLLLTDDGRLQAWIADPKFRLPKNFPCPGGRHSRPCRAGSASPRRQAQ
jgi:23S rRNA pseudouridine2457 synthase